MDVHIKVDYKKLSDLLVCMAEEGDIGDYGTQVRRFFDDIYSKNPSVQAIVKGWRAKWKKKG